MPDGAVRLTDSRSAGRARRRDAHRIPVRAVADRNLSRRNIDYHFRDELGADLFRPRLPNKVLLGAKRIDAAHTRTEIHAEILRCDLSLKGAVFHCFSGRIQRVLRIQIGFADGRLIYTKQRIKIFNFSGKLAAEIRRIETRDKINPAFARNKPIPEFGNAVSDRRKCAETGYDNSVHGSSYMARPPSMRITSPVI